MGEKRKDEEDMLVIKEKKRKGEEKVRWGGGS